MSILPTSLSHLSSEVLSRQLLRKALKNPECSDRPDSIPTYFKVQAKKPGHQRPHQFLKRLLLPGVLD